MSGGRETGAGRFRLVLLLMLLAAALLAAGLLVYASARRAAPVEAQSLQTQTAAVEGFLPCGQPQLRIYDGEVQWYDGARWHTFASAAQLRALDPAASADAVPGAENPAESALYHNRAQGDVPRKGGGGGGAGGGGSGSGSGDGEDINPFG